MIFAYRPEEGHLIEAEPEAALWLDALKPDAAEVARLKPLVPDVPDVPSPEDMAEIEISARLYREGATQVMTVLVPGIDRGDKETPVLGPVAFLLSPGRLVTVRYHAQRPFETYPPHARQSAIGCTSSDRIFLGLVEEIIGRIADLLEGAGRALDQVTQRIFRSSDLDPSPQLLQVALRTAGRQSEMVGNCRLSLLTLERALSFFDLALAERGDKGLRSVIKGLTRDVQSLEVHVDYLSARVSQTLDTTLGMINLAQNTTVRIVSVVAVLFLPPTLIASIYGMNFHLMPELDMPWGYPAALALMVASALITWGIFKWKKWL